MRATIDIRQADAPDLPTVAALCLVAREETGTPAQVCQADSRKIERQLGVLLSVPGGRIDVAMHDGELAGFMLARVVEANIYTDEPVLYIEAVYVAKSFRRRGVGHALLTSAAHTALEAGADEVYSVPIPGSRGVQRFLARLGFAPAAAHRVAPTAALLRKLEAEVSPARRGTRSLEDLIARRRKARIETQSGPVDLRGLQSRLDAAADAAGPDVARAESDDAEVFELEKTIEYPKPLRASNS